jgi:hypothetical protein
VEVDFNQLLVKKLNMMHEHEVDSLITSFMAEVEPNSNPPKPGRDPWKAVPKSPLGDKINFFVRWAVTEQVLEEACNRIDRKAHTGEDKLKAGLLGYCQKLRAWLAQATWGMDHYIQEEARLLPIHASPYEDSLRTTQRENLLKTLRNGRRTIVLGEPGMGKSVALERLAWELAGGNPLIVPILIPLREYDGKPLETWIRLMLLARDEPLQSQRACMII